MHAYIILNQRRKKGGVPIKFPHKLLTLVLTIRLHIHLNTKDTAQNNTRTRRNHSCSERDRITMATAQFAHSAPARVKLVC